MTYEQFYFWLEGFLAGYSDEGLLTLVEVLQDSISKVKNPSMVGAIAFQGCHP